MKRRIFKENVPHHVYVKGKEGGIIFYCLEDCIYYITLYCCLALKHGIVTYAFSLMPNHTHSQQTARSLQSFSAFNGELLCRFTIAYNRQHERSGQLFDTPFGSAPEPVGKRIKSNISYICNNGAAGRLSDGVLDYRWNLVAYCKESNPFSERVSTRTSSRRFLKARKLVRSCREACEPLGYKLQETVYKGLNQKEKMQIIDYILSEYNVLDQEGMILSFGSVDKALIAMEANCGSEHDLKEDWDDYSVYRRIGIFVKGKGLDLRTVNFERMEENVLYDLRKALRIAVGASDRQLDKYLHQSAADKGLCKRTLCTEPSASREMEDRINH